MRIVFAADFATIAWLPCALYLLDARRPGWLAVALAAQWFAGYPPLFLVSGLVLTAYACRPMRALSFTSSEIDP